MKLKRLGVQDVPFASIMGNLMHIPPNTSLLVQLAL